MSTYHPYALITDFSTADGYVGAMKGRLMQLDANAAIIDIAHDIPTFDIRRAAFCLFNSYRYFPEKTIFIVVVDPGVGSTRHALVVKTKDYFFVGPDNGVFSLVYWWESFEAFTVDVAALPGPISSTFHGRDVFVPTAVRVVQEGINSGWLQPFPRPQTIWREPEQLSSNKWQLEVFTIDRFGNLILNAHQRRFSQPFRRLTVGEGKTVVKQFCRSFAEGKANEPMMLWDSSGFLQIAMKEASAAEMLHVKAGDGVIAEL